MRLTYDQVMDAAIARAQAEVDKLKESKVKQEFKQDIESVAYWWNWSGLQ